MMIKASGRSALMVVTGLFVCLAGVSYTTAATEAASSTSESVTATKSVKHGSRHWKRYAHRKYVRTAQKSSITKKAEEKEVADASGEVPVSLPPQVANANARIDTQLDEPSGAAKAMTERANAILLAQADNRPELKPENKPAEAQAAFPAPAPAESQAAAPDQLNDSDRTLQEPKSSVQAAPSQTVAMAATAVKAGTGTPAAASSDTSTWDQTSLIGKIFIAFGALLTIASAARMFMA
jgi:hypothetical protein